MRSRITRPLRRRSLAIVLGIAQSLAVLAGPGDAGAVPVEFFDGTFDDGDWTTTSIQSGQGGVGSAGQVANGGIPGSYREISLTLNAPTPTEGSLVAVVSLRPSAVYTPGTQGAIAFIDYAEDSILLTGVGSGQALTIALEQSGVTYAAIASRLFSPETSWTPKSIPGLVESDFTGLTAAGSPDFSASGAPITFGFWRAISAPVGSGAGMRVGGVDNWSVSVTPVPEPGTALLVMGGILGLALRRSTARPKAHRLP